MGYSATGEPQRPLSLSAMATRTLRITVGGQYPVLIGGASPSHELERTEICRKKAETRDPCGHLATSHEIIFACICALLQIKANRQNEREIENNNGQVNRRKMDEPLGAHLSKGGNHGRAGRPPLIG